MEHDGTDTENKDRGPGATGKRAAAPQTLIDYSAGKKIKTCG
jgi:hypothetical protein